MMTSPGLALATNERYPCYPPYPGMQVCNNPFACKLRVNGKGSVKTQPDVAEVVLGVVTENMQLKTAQEENTVKINNVTAALKEIGISSKDIQTQSYNIDLQYDFVDGKQIFRGYKVSHHLEVTIRDMDRIGETIDKAVQSGANQVSSITFSLSDLSVVYQKALGAAVEDALQKAKTLGDRFGIAVSRTPVQIAEEGYITESPKPTPFMQAAPAATQIQTGQIEVTARITAVFTYMGVQN